MYCQINPIKLFYSHHRDIQANIQIILDMVMQCEPSISADIYAQVQVQVDIINVLCGLPCYYKPCLNSSVCTQTSYYEYTCSCDDETDTVPESQINPNPDCETGECQM